MSEQDKGGANPLAARILADARAEAARIVAEAQEAAGKRREISGEECRAIEAQARARTAERLQALDRSTRSRVSVEARRARLRVRDRIISRALEATRNRLAALAATEDYRRMLVGWIAEAAIGLGEAEAEVNATAAEREALDPALLAEAEREVLQSVGRKVHLTLSSAQPLLGQGVVLTARNGRVAYNNQVATRLLREQTRIRSLIHDALFARE